MKTQRNKIAFSMIEILIAIAIIAILVSIVVTVVTRADSQAKERQTLAILNTLDSALEQFRDFGYNYKKTIFATLQFPMDCSGLTNLQIAAAFGVSSITYSNASELWCFFLNRVPQSRKTVDSIGEAFKAIRSITIAPTVGVPRTHSFVSVLDPWGTPLSYVYVYPPATMNFPLITSAGPDGIFGNNDDITNR